MRLIVISGLSGAGKSVALHTLEDLGFYCVDNLPLSLLVALAIELTASDHPAHQNVAVVKAVGTPVHRAANDCSASRKASHARQMRE